jgi:hypothetical protein
LIAGSQGLGLGCGLGGCWLLSSVALQGVVGSAWLECLVLAALHSCCAGYSVIMMLLPKKVYQRRSATFRLRHAFGWLQARPGGGTPIEGSTGACSARQLAAAAGCVRPRLGAEDLAVGWGGNGARLGGALAPAVACLPALPSTLMPILLLAV